MKPINPQDRQKVIVLAVVLVCVLGFVLKTVLGMMAAKGAVAAKPPTPPVPSSTQSPTTEASGKPSSTDQGAPATLTTPTDNTTPKLATDPTGIEMGGPANPFRKVLPDPASLSNPGPPITGIAPPKGPGRMTGGLPTGGLPPFPTDGMGAQTVPLEPSFKLDGVMADRENLAMVTVGSKTDIYRAGAKIAKVFEVISVDSYGASFRGPGGVFRLEVGQEHTPAPAPAPSKSGATNYDSSALPLPNGH